MSAGGAPVRNRVGSVAARTAATTSKLVLVLVLVPTALVVAAQGAAAAPVAEDDVAATSVSFGLLGPVGIGAVVLGFGGLVIGLLRHRRRVVTAAATGAVTTATVTLPVDATGTLPVLDTAAAPQRAAGERVG
ncbi:hypothetical protein BLA60_38105 [Actinophytocola xinjiangensis]|uniref:Uncharacterized protein n=1 Tax=Actinophytocola xinjiangensis TaxID=485602 RepID=A0A7Z0WDU8_9PSEU|nr:hypothetical protein BLA60_38105 [Actinophytocola xinjiangensis]